MPSQTTLTLLHKEAKKRVFLQGTVTYCTGETHLNICTMSFNQTAELLQRAYEQFEEV